MKEYTVKDLADLLGVSKPTIQRAINAADLQPNREESQTRYYGSEAAVLIASKVNPDFDFTAYLDPPQNVPPQAETPTQITETPQQSTETEPKQTETPQQTELEIMRSMLKTIQAQLDIKDKQISAYEEQIAIQNQQIKDYSERLKEAIQITRGQQYLTAAEIIQAQPDPEAPAPSRFWFRLFKRKGNRNV